MTLSRSLRTGGSSQTFVDDVFSAFTYTGNGSTQTITNGVDLAGKGGLVWQKNRTNGAASHILVDSARGVSKVLSTDLTGASADGFDVTAFNSNGFSVQLSSGNINNNGVPQISWTFRKAPKFFDVVTYTGNGTAGRAVAHSLGVAPGLIIAKNVTNGAQNAGWVIYHRSLGATKMMYLNTTGAQVTDSSCWNGQEPTSSVFYLGNGETNPSSGDTYVAYLFAHDASTDGLIQCGSFTTDGSGNATVTLGWEPQFVLTKTSTSTSNWQVIDTARGLTADGGNNSLYANLSSSESGPSTGFRITATGLTSNSNQVSQTYIYLAIRRPNKPPTTGTQVYNAIARTGTGNASFKLNTGFPADLLIQSYRGGTFYNTILDRLRGSALLSSQLTESESGANNSNQTPIGNVWGGGNDSNSILLGNNNNGLDQSGSSYIDHFFKRAPGVMDTICWTGNGANRTLNHNLTAIPELMIVKARSSAGNWAVYHKDIGNTKFLRLQNSGEPLTDSTVWNNTTPTSTVFSVGTSADVNGNTVTYVGYLMATLAGVSKVGSYTGNGSTQTIDCGFATGARFILIKRYAAGTTGDFFVWDTVRGIVAGNDPHLSLNTTAVEVTSNDSIDPASNGFVINQVGGIDINVNASTYIFWAVA